MKCPICKKPVELSEPDFPFCSGRCRLLDLGNWASEKYVISTPTPELQQKSKPDPDEED
jgi:endogenous inhibitor of DNA gyrase (YacG/DUF329 family)